MHKRDPSLDSAKVAKLDIIGPFSYSGKESFQAFDITRVNSNTVNNSAGVSLSWFSVDADSAGTFNINSYYPTESNSFFVARHLVDVAEDGTYQLTIGKTGFLELYIDGQFQEGVYNRHFYHPIQYTKTVHLTKGEHSLTFKLAGNEEHSRQFSLRFAKKNKTSAFLSSSFVDSSIRDALTDSKDYCDAGYLFYKKGRYGNDKQTLEVLNRVSQASSYYNESLFYKALASHNYDIQNYYLQKIHSDPVLARVEYNKALLTLYGKSEDQALSYLKELNSEKSSNYLTSLLKIKIFNTMNWEFEALESIENLRSKSLTLYTKYMAEYSYKKAWYSKAAHYYRLLLSQNRENIFFQNRLLYCTKLSTPPGSYINELYKAITAFPDRVGYKVELGKSLYKMGLYSQALTALSSAQKQSPVFASSFYWIAKTQLALGNKLLAKNAIKRAIALHPDNEAYTRFFTYTFKKNDHLEEYLAALDLDELSHKAAQYKNEAALLLHYETVEELKSDGSTLRRVRKAYKINDFKNCEHLKRFSFSVNNESERVLAVQSSVIIDNNVYSSQKISKRDISDPESKLYYDITVWTAEVPVIKDGAILLIDYTIQSREGLQLQGYFGKRYYFSNYYRIINAHNTVITPKATNLSYKLNKLNENNLKKVSKYGKTVYSFFQENIEPSPYEEHEEPYYNATPSITYSTFKNWDEFYSWYASLIEPRTVISEEMKLAVKEIVSFAKTDKEKIDLIYRHVIDRIRYVGFEIGVGGIRPRYTNITYQSKLGDCKDIALLLAALFKEAGIDASLTLIRTAGKGYPDLDIAYVSNFNHAICYVEYQGGLFLDGTIDKAGIFDLPESDRDTEVLIIGEKAHTFRYIDNASYAQSVDSITTDVAVHEDGSATLTRSLTKHGPSAMSFRYNYTTDHQKNIDLGRYWNSYYPGSTVSEYTVTNREGTGPLHYSYTISIPHFAKQSKPYYFFPVTLLPSHFVKSFTPTISRKQNLFINNYSDVRSTVKVTLPKNMSVHSIPESRVVSHKSNKASFTFDKTSSQSYTTTFNWKVSRLMLRPNEYESYREFMTTLDAKESEYIIIKMSE